MLTKMLTKKAGSKTPPALSFQAMLDPISFFCLFGIVPSVDGAHEVTGDPADPLKLDAFSCALHITTFISFPCPESTMICLTWLDGKSIF